MDHEDKLASLNPTVEWETCDIKDCLIKEYLNHIGKVIVPSDYENPSKGTFTLYAKRYTKPASDPVVHIILLTGGPGGAGDCEGYNVELLMEKYGKNVAVYTVDHRGLGASGAFPFVRVKKFDKLKDEELLAMCKEGKFDIKDLTMTNAALDVSMLGMAIKKNAPPKVRVVLQGFSYGAQWAHHIVQLTPGLFDSALLSGLPRINGIDHLYSLVGLAEMCAKDEFCRSKMGGNVYANMNTAVRNLGNANYNECTKLFHEQLREELRGTVGERTREIVLAFSHLLMEYLEQFSRKKGFRSPQLMLPFLMATEKCVDKTEYRDKVLQPMLKLVRPHYLRHQKNGDLDDFDLHGLVHAVIKIDIAHQDFQGGEPKPPANHTDLHVSVSSSSYYYPLWTVMKQLLSGRKISKEHPVVTSKTDMYVMASRMDLNTTYMPIWELFNRIVAPTKKWLLFDNEKHNGYWGKCRDMLEREATFGTVSGFDYEECVRRTNAEYKLDWTFANTGEYERMWDCVPDATDLAVVISNVPVFLEVGEKMGRGMRKTNNFIRMTVFGAVGLLIAALVIFAIYKYKTRASNNPCNEQNVL